jgi:hypothetical protein
VSPAALSQRTAVGKFGSPDASFDNVIVLMRAFVLALRKLTLTQGVAESSRTASGRTFDSEVPCSRETRAWAVIVGLIPRSGRNKRQAVLGDLDVDERPPFSVLVE